MHRKPRIKVFVPEVQGNYEYRVLEEVPLNEGTSFTYKNYQEETTTVNVPKGYKYAEKDGFKYCGREPGNVTACPIRYVAGFQIGDPGWDIAPGANWTRFLTNDLTARYTKSIHGKKDIPWIWILVILAVVVIAYFGFKQMNKSSGSSEGAKVTPVEQGQNK